MTRVGLKIDVDTFVGSSEGIAPMLDALRRAGARASFFFTLGPDRSGRAIFRVFRKRGFVGKMVRTNALKMYGLRTVLYGTLLPSPDIGRRCADVIRRCRDEGHEVGLHAWDHIAWQDGLDRMTRGKIDDQLRRGNDAFTRIFGEAPRAFAAPAWYCTSDGFRALNASGFDYTSVTRGLATPFFPVIDGEELRTLEIPTTLPTLDEELGRDGTNEANFVERLIARYRPDGDEILTVHAETEGRAFLGLFTQLLREHGERNVSTVPLRTIADSVRAAAKPGHVALGEVPGRSGNVVLAL